MSDDPNAKERLTLWLEKNTIALIKHKAALDRSSISQVIEDLIKEKIKIKDIIAGLTACEVIVPDKKKK